MDDIPRDRDETSGRFLPGNSGCGGGRRLGSRNFLTGEFLDDLRETWGTHGKTALDRCAKEDPVAFCQLVARLLPAKAELDVNLDLSGARTVLEAYRMMAGMLGANADVAIRSLRRAAPDLLEYD